MRRVKKIVRKKWRMSKKVRLKKIIKKKGNLRWREKLR